MGYCFDGKVTKDETIYNETIFKRSMEKYKELITTPKIKYVMKRIFEAIDLNLEHKLNQALETLPNISVKIVSGGAFAGMIGIDCVYINQLLINKKKNEEEKLAQIVGTIIHEAFHDIFRKIHENFLISTPIQKQSFFEMGNNR